MNSKKILITMMFVYIFAACLLSAFRIGNDVKIVSPGSATSTAGPVLQNDSSEEVSSSPAIDAVGGPAGAELIAPQVTPEVRWWNEEDIVPTEWPEDCWGVLSGATDIRGCDGFMIPTGEPTTEPTAYAYP